MPTIPALPTSTFDPDSLIYFCDMIGIVACSVAGTLLARSKNFDPMGCILVSMVNAIGGGTVRDVMLNRHILFWMLDGTYILVITLTSVIFQLFFTKSRRLGEWLKIADAVGLAAFTLIGVQVALSYGATKPIAMLMGIITTIVGGMIRDIICHEIPMVLRREIYITASMAGALVYFSLDALRMSEWVISGTTMLVVFCVRMMAIYRDWHIPALNTWFRKN